MAEDLKNPSVDTVTPPVTETGEGQGTVAEVKEDTVTPVAETKPTEEMVSVKELEKARMRTNQLENELENARKLAESAGNNDLVASLQSKLSELENERLKEKQSETEKAERERFNRLRESIIDEQPELKEPLQKLLAANEYAVYPVSTMKKVDNGEYNTVDGGFDSYRFDRDQREEMKRQIQTLAGLQETVKPEIKVDATNPAIQPVEPETLEIVASPNDLSKSEHDLLHNIAKTDFTKLYSGDF